MSVTYASAVTKGRNAVKTQDGAAWILGDLAANVAPKYGDKTLQKLAEDISSAGRELAYKTLINYRTVCAAYTPADRSDNNSFAVHAKFASLEDRVTLVSSRKWTVAEAVAEVKSRATSDDAGNNDGNNDGNTSEPAASLSEIEKTRLNIQRLQAELAAAYVKLAKLEAEDTTTDAPVTAPKVTAPKVTAPKVTAPKVTAPKVTAPKVTAPKVTAPAMHIVRGVPPHSADSPRTDCPTCKKNGVVPMPATPRTSRTRQVA